MAKSSGAERAQAWSASSVRFLGLYLCSQRQVLSDNRFAGQRFRISQKCDSRELTAEDL